MHQSPTSSKYNAQRLAGAPDGGPRGTWCYFTAHHDTTNTVRSIGGFLLDGRIEFSVLFPSLILFLGQHFSV